MSQVLDIFMINVADPQRLLLQRRNELHAAFERVLESGNYILGPEVHNFEQEFARWIGLKHVVGVANATDALELALEACGVGPGDEVITVSHTAVATVAAIVRCGAVPVYVDVELDTANIDVELLTEELITPRTKALICVHLYGRPANVKMVKKFCNSFSLKLIEDCSQAHGASVGTDKVGTFGDVACFSSYPTKNLPALGDAGLAVTNCDDIARHMRASRQYGWTRRYVSDTVGRNSRLDELQAAILRVNLGYLAHDNLKRIEIARRYDERFESLEYIMPFKEQDGSNSVYHLYVIRLEERTRFMEYMLTKGVSTAIHYPVPVHLQPPYSNVSNTSTPLGNTELLATQVCSLPMHPNLTTSEIDRVIEAVTAFK